VELTQAAASIPDDIATDRGPSTSAEVAKVIGRLKAGKTPGICGIPSELLKAGGDHTVQWLTNVFQTVWESGRMPPD